MYWLDFLKNDLFHFVSLPFKLFPPLMVFVCFVLEIAPQIQSPEHNAQDQWPLRWVYYALAGWLGVHRMFP